MSEVETTETRAQPITKNDPTKVSKPSRENSTQITKKERSPAQLANDRRLAQLSIERKEKKLAEIKKSRANGVVSTPKVEYESSSTILLVGLGGITMAILAVAVWFLFFKKSEKVVIEEEQEESGYVSE